MCFTLIWHIEHCSFYKGWSTKEESASDVLFRTYSPWFVVQNTRLRLAIFPTGWRIFRSEDTQENDIEYETCLDPDSNTPHSTDILYKNSLYSWDSYNCNFLDMITEQDSLTLRLRVRSSEPGFCRFRTVLRLVSRFEVKITTFSHKLDVGAIANGQVNKFLVSNNFLPTTKPSYLQDEPKDQEIHHHKHVIIQCSQYGQVYFGLTDGSSLHQNSYITVSLINSHGKKIVSQTQGRESMKFSTNPPLSAIGNNVLVEWFERVDETVEFGRNTPYTHFPLHRNRFSFPYKPSFTVKKPDVISSDTDFILEVQSKCFPVHSQVLLQHSEFFRRMLESDMKEKGEGRVILDTDAETAERIVKYLYEGVVKSTLEAEQVFSLYVAATMYQILDLQKDCSSLLASKLDPSSVCGILALAEAHRDQRLKTKTQNFICANRDDVLNSSEWRLFSKSHRPLANEMKNIVESCSGQKW